MKVSYKKINVDFKSDEALKDDYGDLKAEIQRLEERVDKYRAEAGYAVKVNKLCCWLNGISCVLCWVIAILIVMLKQGLI